VELHRQTGEIVGAEALIRWMHPERGLIPPGEFITLAEETGFIHAMSDWVFERVCRQLNQWEAEGCTLVPISINLSAKSLMHAALADRFKGKLSEHRIDTRLIEIEITENSYIGNKAIRPSVNLKKFKVDYIKIDRSFIQDIEHNAEDFIIVQSIILLARGFQLKIIAEGVETEAQWELLRSLDCHYIQGYLFSRPLPSEQLGVMLRSDRKLLRAR
jgi:EAL domain-containing protein (putative c-di-GMP-specific phosphodiesterase class I)